MKNMTAAARAFALSIGLPLQTIRSREFPDLKRSACNPTSLLYHPPRLRFVMPRQPHGEDVNALIQHALRGNAMMARWPDAVRDRLMRIARLERYERNKSINAEDRQRREVMLIVSGRLEVSGVNVSGAKFVLGIQGPGEVTSMVRLLKGVHLRYDYYALEDMVLVHLPSDPFCTILDEHPLLWRDVALFALRRLNDSLASLHRRALCQIPQSLAETLVKLVEDFGQVTEGGLRLRVSQSELAAMLSVTRQTINKELRLLADQGVLVAEYGCLMILDFPKLKHIAM